MQVTIKNRAYKVKPTGLKNVPYKLVSGKLELTGIRQQRQPNVIIVLDSRSRKVGAFDENTGNEMVNL
jgi:hypothetical protein